MNNSLKYIFSHAHLNIKTRKPFVRLCARCPHFSVRWHVLREVQHGPFHWGGKRTLWTWQDLLNGQEAKYLCLGWMTHCVLSAKALQTTERPSWMCEIAVALGITVNTVRLCTRHLQSTLGAYLINCMQLSWSGKGRTWCIDRWQSLWLRGSSSQGLGHWAICCVGEGL